MTDATEPSVEDRLTFGTNAHAAAPDEDPMNHLGPEIPDPWDDDEQDDWASMSTKEVEG